jgi:hypothetical protein
MFVGGIHEAALRLSFRLEAEVLALSEVEWAAMEKSPWERASPYPCRTSPDRTAAQGRHLRLAPKEISPRRYALVEMTDSPVPAATNLPTNMNRTHDAGSCGQRFDRGHGRWSTVPFRRGGDTFGPGSSTGSEEFCYG